MKTVRKEDIKRINNVIEILTHEAMNSNDEKRVENAEHELRVIRYVLEALGL